MKTIYLVSFIAFFVAQSQAFKFTRCGLVRELRRQGFPEDKMRDWVCLIEHESGRRTNIVGPRNKNGSFDYGLFQINDGLWCNNSTTPGKGCHVTCSELLTDDITKACTCAKKIFKIQGFLAWYGWRNHCQHPGDLPDISMC
ncbi:hypothetical protein ABMA28_002319 [Loxostege sticticalis]|uniref:Lysozyme n=1 Tax=Loxostege sticticalis TaxID=481309 RepID=A0ABD0T0N5_LOXSC